MSLTSFIPKESELEKVSSGTYSVTLKGGFAYSNDYGSNSFKKKKKMFIKQGSCFFEDIEGQMFVEENSKHPIYTYGRPIMIGVDFND